MAGGPMVVIGVMAAVLAVRSATPADIPPDVAPTDWPVTFDDEFVSLDFSRWDTPYPWGGRHLKTELQMYVDPAYTGDTEHPLGLNPFSVTNGILTIRADRATPHIQGQAYTSGILTTSHAFTQQYGYFEMRARFPAGKGLWPAFWLASPVSWPPEIDIVEILGDQPTTLNATVWWKGANGSQSKGFMPTVSDVTSAFHIYGVSWTPAFIAWYFDRKRVAYFATPADLHEPMFILVNLAVGGDWPGAPNARTKFPADMQIDYVRAYALPR